MFENQIQAFPFFFCDMQCFQKAIDISFPKFSCFIHNSSLVSGDKGYRDFLSPESIFI